MRSGEQIFFEAKLRSTAARAARPTPDLLALVEATRKMGAAMNRMGLAATEAARQMGASFAKMREEMVRVGFTTLPPGATLRGVPESKDGK